MCVSACVHEHQAIIEQLFVSAFETVTVCVCVCVCVRVCAQACESLIILALFSLLSECLCLPVALI